MPQSTFAPKASSLNPVFKALGGIATGVLGVTLFFNADSASAQVTFDLRSSPAVSANSFTFSSGGINLTINTVPPTALSNSNNRGICAFSDLAGCGDTSNPKGTILDGLTFSFDTPVELISYDITRVRVNPGVPPATVSYTPTWSSASGSQSFARTQTFTSSPNVDNPPGITFAPGLFGTTFTNTTAFSTQDALFEYRINNLRVDRYTPPASVPGPLPIFAAATAFGWSRKLRGRTAKAG